jgi:rod shape-determining protein MreC
VRPLSSPNPKRRRSRYYVLLVVTLAAVTLITLDARGVVALSSAREGAIDLFSPVRGAARWVTTPFRNGWNGITGYEELQQENEDLRNELEELRGDRWKDQDAAEELARLEEQLGITYLQGLDTQIARVTTGPYSNFTDHTLQLDRGRDAGLEVGMPVVQRDGLVGRIVRVSDTRSVVQLITDPDMWIGIRLSRSGVIGKGHGGGDETTFIGEVSLDTGAPVEERELVVTGGIERSIMPPGNQIPVGTVDKVTPDEAARVQTLQISYSVDFGELDVVQVVKWVPES